MIHTPHSVSGLALAAVLWGGLWFFLGMFVHNIRPRKHKPKPWKPRRSGRRR